MKMNYNKLENLVKSHNLDIVAFCTSIGMSKGGYYRMLQDKTLKVEVLERISDVLGVPVGVFFDEEPTTAPINYQKKYIECLEENSRLQKEMSSLKDEIRSLEKNSPLSDDATIPKLKTR
jgi:transcriptional regulator with XRE-family HTH domain